MNTEIIRIIQQEEFNMEMIARREINLVRIDVGKVKYLQIGEVMKTDKLLIRCEGENERGELERKINEFNKINFSGKR